MILLIHPQSVITFTDEATGLGLEFAPARAPIELEQTKPTRELLTIETWTVTSSVPVSEDVLLPIARVALGDRAGARRLVRILSAKQGDGYRVTVRYASPIEDIS